LVKRRLGENAKDEICDLANEGKLIVRGMSEGLPYQLRYAHIGREHGLELVAKWVDWENSADGHDDGIIAITRNLQVKNNDAFRSLLTGHPTQKNADDQCLEGPIDGRARTVAAEATQSLAKSLKLAPDAVIREAITSAYDAMHVAGEKPPNVKELPAAVLPLLEKRGYRASARIIETLGGAAEYKRRRRPPGKTVSSEQRARQK
jgi:hypothetical protein